MKLAAALVLAAASTAALACGVCVDDKVAAVYDHAVVTRAFAQGRVIVVCELFGPNEAAAQSRAATQAAKALRGVDPASVRSSANPAVVSFSLDARQDPQQVVAALHRSLASAKVQPVLLKVLERTPRAPLP